MAVSTPEWSRLSFAVASGYATHALATFAVFWDLFGGSTCYVLSRVRFYSKSSQSLIFRVDTPDGKKPILTVVNLCLSHQCLETTIKKMLSVMMQKSYIVGNVCLVVSPWCVSLLYSRTATIIF